VLVLWTGRSDGDRRSPVLAPPAPVPAGHPVVGLRQVHGDGVVVVRGGSAPVLPRVPLDGVGEGASEGGDGRPTAYIGDALVSVGGGVTLTVLTADCAPVALGSPGPPGLHAAVHAGWRGLAAGVLDRALDTMRSLGAVDVVAGLGPCIGPCCYEFEPELAASVSQQVGADVAATTGDGRPSLDLRHAVRARLRAHGVPLAVRVDRCTACSPGYYSHRARGDEARQAMFVWRAA